MAKSTDIITTFLAECRHGAATSAATSIVVEKIETKIGTLRADRAKLEGQLQDAVVAGTDPGKTHTIIAQVDQDLMTLQAAVAGFSARQADQAKLEEAAEVATFLDKHRTLSEELAQVSEEKAAAIEAVRVIVAREAEIVRAHDRAASNLEASGERPQQRAATIMRKSVGEIRRGEGTTEYSRRADILLAEILDLNPGQLLRARDARRQGMRFGASRAATDHTVEAILAPHRRVS